MTTKDNTGTLPINLYEVGPLNVQPNCIGDHHSVQHTSQKEETEFLNTLNQIYSSSCVKGDKGGFEIILVLACL